MRRLGPIDRALLATLLPLWLACFTLHVREVVRTGFALPPVFVTPADQDGFPVVAGLRPETYIADPELRACLESLAGQIAGSSGPPAVDNKDIKPLPIIRSIK